MRQGCGVLVGHGWRMPMHGLVWNREFRLRSYKLVFFSRCFVSKLSRGCTVKRAKFTYNNSTTSAPFLGSDFASKKLQVGNLRGGASHPNSQNMYPSGIQSMEPLIYRLAQSLHHCLPRQNYRYTMHALRPIVHEYYCIPLSDFCICMV
jgi:hypothetical protein